MSPTESSLASDSFKLGPHDAALIIREDLSTELVIPHQEDGDELADSSTMAVFYLSFALQDTSIMEQLRSKAEGKLEEDSNGNV